MLFKAITKVRPNYSEGYYKIGVFAEGDISDWSIVVCYEGRKELIIEMDFSNLSLDEIKDTVRAINDFLC